MLDHPILQASFAEIDRRVEQDYAKHGLMPLEYDLARRVIHSTADFEFLELLSFSPRTPCHCLTAVKLALQQQVPIVVDVKMVQMGIQGMIQRTWQNPIVAAIDHGHDPKEGKTRTETGLKHCMAQYPEAIYVIGNAPTALLALCQAINRKEVQPALVISVPVGFIGVLEAKAALLALDCPQIVTQGHKGGSAVAAALVNALARQAWLER